MPSGIYFDGHTSARQDVSMTLGPATLRIEAADGRLLAEWPYEDIEGLAAPDAVLRLGRRNNAILERLEVTDPQFAAEIDGRAHNIDRAGRAQRGTRHRVVGWSLAATLSLLLVAWFGVPAIAERLAPLLAQHGRAQSWARRSTRSCATCSTKEAWRGLRLRHTGQRDARPRRLG